MIKNAVIIEIFLLLISGIQAYANETSQASGRILHVTEYDQDGKSNKIAEGNSVDVNSVLLINIDKQEIIKKSALYFSNTIISNLIDNISNLTVNVHSVQTNFGPYSSGTYAWYTNGMPSGGKIFDEMTNQRSIVAKSFGGLSALVYKMPRIRANFNQLRRQALEKNDKSDETQYKILIESANNELEQLKGDLKKALKEEGIFLQTGGWVTTPGGQIPLHLPGFDDLEEQPYNMIDRVKLTLSEEDKKALKLNGELADYINKNNDIEANITNILYIITGSLFTNSIQSINNIMGSIKTDSAAYKQISTNIANLTNYYNEILSGINDIKEIYGNIKTQSYIGILVDINDDLETIAGNSKKILNETEIILKSGNNIITNEFGKLKTALNEDLNNIKIITGNLKYAQSSAYTKTFAENVKDFSAEVKKLSIDETPGETRLPLSNSGRQGEGDKIFLKVLIGRIGEKTVTADEMTISIQRVIPYITTVPGLILASVPGSNPVTFQAAAAYSVLIKFGCRNNYFINNLLEFGIGINISAPDFNHDNSPELGVGLTMSFFRDVVSLGYGYNVFYGKDFYFVGLNLPLGNFGLPELTGKSQ